jgi:hypothetical protein
MEENSFGSTATSSGGGCCVLLAAGVRLLFWGETDLGLLMMVLLDRRRCHRRAVHAELMWA